MGPSSSNRSNRADGDAEVGRAAPVVEVVEQGATAREVAPVPGWVAVVRLAAVAAAACEPPAAFQCRARWGRLSWFDVRGPRAFVELLWALEELSSTLCEVCGAPAVARETWDRSVHTLCPRHAVAVVAAGPHAETVYDHGWASLREHR